MYPADSGIDEDKWKEDKEEEEDPLVFERQLDDVFNVMASGERAEVENMFVE